jgi:diacylglycerol kinase (ATP)
MMRLSEPGSGTDPGMDALIAAFCNSMRGFATALRSERAVRQELMVLAAAVPAAYFISQDLWIRVALVGVILVTMAVELLNTAVEKLCDHVTPERHVSIGEIKDMGSAAVFCMLALSALVWTGALIAAI